VGHPKGAPQIPRYARNDKKERVVVEKGELPKDKAFFISLGRPKAHLTRDDKKERTVVDKDRAH
jgi:hypothetical protein